MTGAVRCTMRARARSFPRLKGEGTLVDADSKGEFKQALPVPKSGHKLDGEGDKGSRLRNHQQMEEDAYINGHATKTQAARYMVEGVPTCESRNVPGRTLCRYIILAF